MAAMVGRAVTTTTQPVSKPTPSWEVRGWREGDEKLLREIDDLAFGYSAPEERWSEELATLERDRTVFVADPADPAAIIGSAGAFTFEVSVPGGRTVAAAGVSWVSVYPTHRRRGIPSPCSGAARRPSTAASVTAARPRRPR
jgi:GNAT superfamily N-acetyltransferase